MGVPKVFRNETTVKQMFKKQKSLNEYVLFLTSVTLAHLEECRLGFMLFL